LMGLEIQTSALPLNMMVFASKSSILFLLFIHS
jgi:hypothetical protein